MTILAAIPDRIVNSFPTSWLLHIARPCPSQEIIYADPPPATPPTEQEIMDRTEHRSTEAVRSYKRTSQQQNEQVSDE